MNARRPFRTPASNTSRLQCLLVVLLSMRLTACLEPRCAGEDCGVGETQGDGPACDPSAEIITISEELPIFFDGNLGSSDRSQGSCGGAGSEAVFSWTPPAPGTYVFYADALSGDLLMYLRDASAGPCGPELDCNDDGAYDDQDPLIVETLSTDPVTIFVDAREDDEQTAFTLRIYAHP